MHEFLPASHASIADALIETRMYWEDLNTESVDEVVQLPEDVIERLAIAYFEMYEDLEFEPLRKSIKTLSASEQERERQAGDVLERFFSLLCTLYKANVEPFVCRRPTAAEFVEQRMSGGDWDAVPEDLRYLQGVSERFWRYTSPDLYEGNPQQDLTSQDKRMLHSVAKTVNREGHQNILMKCISTDGNNNALRKMCCLMELLDQLGLLH